MIPSDNIRQILEIIGKKLSAESEEWYGAQCWLMFRYNAQGQALWKRFEKELIYVSSFHPTNERITILNEGMRLMFLYMNLLMDEHEQKLKESEGNEDDGGYDSY